MSSGTSTIIKRASIKAPSETDRVRWHQRASSLYEELRGPATGLVRRAYGPTFGPDEIDDIYSSAWLGTLKALERRQGELTDEEVRSYLLTAVANHASKEIRRRRRKPIAPLEAAGSVVEVGETPEEAAATRETGELTRDLLSSLPPRRRAVMLLRYGWGLEPSEVCSMVEGLSPRAYRKEVTRGVDELTERIKLVEDGRWCQEREPVLKAYASGLASQDQTLQAQHHMSHCRSCTEFVGKLTGHLHDVGSALLLPGALEAANGHAGLLGKLRDAGENVRESAAGTLSRSDPTESVAVVTGARGAGVAGAGAVAKLSGLGGGAKAALVCLGGSVAATACVAVGIPLVATEERPEVPKAPEASILPPKDPQVVRAEEPIDGPRPQAPVGEASNDPPDPDKVPPAGDSRPVLQEPSEPAAPSPVVEPDTPPVAQELGEESVAAPADGPPPAPAHSGSGGGAVATEFGP